MVELRYRWKNPFIHILTELRTFYCSSDHGLIIISSILTADAGKDTEILTPQSLSNIYVIFEYDLPAVKLPHGLFNRDFLMLEGEHDPA